MRILKCCLEGKVFRNSTRNYAKTSNFKLLNNSEWFGIFSYLNSRKNIKTCLMKGNWKCKIKKPEFISDFSEMFWCPGRDSNSYTLSGATPSRWYVCQFHHLGLRDSDGIRTHDPLIKSQMLYQLSYGINLPSKKEHKITAMNLIVKQFFKKYLLYFLFAVISCVSPDSGFGAILDDANAAFENGKYEKSLQLFNQVKDITELKKADLYRMAFLNEKINNYPEALFYLNKILLEYGNDAALSARIKKLESKLGFYSTGSAYSRFGFAWIFARFSWIFILLLVLSSFACTVGLWKSNRVLIQIGLPFAGVIAIIMISSKFLLPNPLILIAETTPYSGPSYGANMEGDNEPSGKVVLGVRKTDLWVKIRQGNETKWVRTLAVREL